MRLKKVKFLFFILWAGAPFFYCTDVMGQYPGKNQYQHLLDGAVDMHIHSSPDAFDRSLNDLELAALAQRQGLKAIVIKNHVSSTAGRAELVNSQFDKIQVFGGIALNKAVGGINPQAVHWMSRISPDYGKIVWFPTFDASHHMAEFNIQGEGIAILSDGKLTSATLQVLDIIAEQDLVLATGHLSPAEVIALVKEAKTRSIEKIVITHPLADAPGMGTDQLKEMVQMGALLELTYLSFLSGPNAPLGFLQGSKHVSIEQMVAAIKEIGADHFILSTDLGQSGNATPPDGLKNFIELMIKGGISEAALEKMIKLNPSRLLDL
ncbi:MAG: DUF6282 family protein [Candidatus Cyclobacteriaceae bacterium M3_2C_046]